MALARLRLRRLAHRVSQSDIAAKLDCSRSWIDQIENRYSGPACRVWEGKYAEALEAILEERRADK